MDAIDPVTLAHTDPSTPVGRLAPSPTGALHIGNARSFLVAWLRARQQDGRLILRLDDLDHPRVKPRTIDAVYSDLQWLGLDWDEGPPNSFAHTATATPGPHAPYVQSERTSRYRAAFGQLRAAGLLYPCACSRQDVLGAQSAPHESRRPPPAHAGAAGEGHATPADAHLAHESRYPGTCRDRFDTPEAAQSAAGGRPPAWRFRVEAVAVTSFTDQSRGLQTSRPAAWSGDFPVARGLPDAAPGSPLALTFAYQLATVVDDAAMGVTEVLRGDDLLASTHRQLLLYAALDLSDAVPAFGHLPLILGPDGRRLAKRHGDTRLSAVRAAGTPATALLRYLAQTLALDVPSAPSSSRADLLDTMTAALDLDRLPREPTTLRDADQRALGLIP